MARITGLGGVFYQSPDVERTKAWYVDVLGLVVRQGMTRPKRALIRPPTGLARGSWMPYGPPKTRNRRVQRPAWAIIPAPRDCMPRL